MSDQNKAARLDAAAERARAAGHEVSADRAAAAAEIVRQRLAQTEADNYARAQQPIDPEE